MGSFWMHVFYFAVIMYGYKAYETYQMQRVLNVDVMKAMKAGVMWPKYLFSVLLVVMLFGFGTNAEAQTMLSCVPVTGGTSWAAHPDTDVTKFNLYQSDVSQADLTAKLNAKSPMVSVQNIPANMVNGRPTYKFKGTDLVDGKTYYYAITAMDAAANESALSNVVSCTVIPKPPTGFKVE